jgi:hypothetical protein
MLNMIWLRFDQLRHRVFLLPSLAVNYRLLPIYER